MDSYRVGALAGVVSVVSLLIQHVPEMLLSRWTREGFMGMVPMVGTAGQTVTTYTLLLGIIGPLTTLILAVGLGYYVAQQVAFSLEYRRVIIAIGAGSTVGVTLATAPILFIVTFSSLDAFSVFLAVLSLASALVSVALVVTVGAIAGAALTHFQIHQTPPAQQTDTDTTSQTGTHAESANSTTSQSQS